MKTPTPVPSISRSRGIGTISEQVNLLLLDVASHVLVTLSRVSHRSIVALPCPCSMVRFGAKGIGRLPTARGRGSPYALCV